MAKFVEIKKALRSQEPDSIIPIVQSFIRSEKGNYDRVLQQMMYLAGSEHIDSTTPLGVIYLDAIRDLLTLYEDVSEDPLPLMKECIRYFSALDLEEYSKDLIQVTPADVQDPVFMGDLEEYVRDGEREKAVHEAAKLLMMMDNHFYLVEVLTEIAASCVVETGMPLILAGSVLKSVEYVGSSKYKTLVYLLTDYLSRLQIGWDVRNLEQEFDREIIFAEYYAKAFANKGIYGLNITVLAQAQQIWESVRIKDVTIQQYIQRFIEQKFDPMISNTSFQNYTPKEGSLHFIADALQGGKMDDASQLILSYAQRGESLGALFRVFVRLALENKQPVGPHDLILLNAYRTAVAYLNPPEQYQALLEAAQLVHRLHVREIIDK